MSFLKSCGLSLFGFLCLVGLRAQSSDTTQIWTAVSGAPVPVVVGTGGTLVWGHNPETGTTAEIALLEQPSDTGLIPAEGLVTVYRSGDGVPVAYAWASARAGVAVGAVEVVPGGFTHGTVGGWTFEARPFSDLRLIAQGSANLTVGLSATASVETVVAGATTRLINPSFRFEGLAPGAYTVVAWHVYKPWLGNPRALQGLTNGAPSVVYPPGPPELDLMVEAISPTAGRFENAESEIAVFSPGYHRLRWGSRQATSLALSIEGRILSTEFQGVLDVTEPSNRTLIYRARAVGPRGDVVEKRVVVHVLARDASLIFSPALPRVALASSPAHGVLGDSFSVSPTVERPSDVARSRLRGPELDMATPPPVLAVRPTLTGIHRYTLRAEGVATLSWLIPFTPERLFINRPDGSRTEVTGRAVLTVAEGGSYSLTWVDGDGSEFSSQPVSVVLASAEVTTEFAVAPRIDAFTLEAPPPPSASLAAPGARVEVGDSIPWNVAWTGAGATLTSEGRVIADPSPVAVVEAVASGRRLARLDVTPQPHAALRWSVAGAEQIEINGVARGGEEWRTAPPGAYRLRAVGRDGIVSESETVSWTLAAPASAEAEVAVYPKINRLSLTQPEVPTVTWDLTPHGGWVNPAPVQLAWSSRAAQDVFVSATGRGVVWSSHEREGTTTLRLGPGPQQFALRATALPALASWAVTGATAVEWVSPGGEVTLGTDREDRLAPLAGVYRLRAIGNDGLVTEASTEPVVIPAPIELTREETVDVTLTLGSSRGGRVVGAGVKAYGSTASFSAEPERGYHWVEWQGDNANQANPSTLAMTDDRTVTAFFAPNRYLLSASVSPAGTGTVSGEGSYLFQTQATLAVAPARYYRLLRWSDGNRSMSRTFSVEEDSSLVALMERIQYRLNLSVTGSGVGTLSVASGRKPAGIPVTVSAQPDARSRFLGWSGYITTLDRSVTVPMEEDVSLVARFEPKLVQSIQFPAPGDREKGESVTLRATSSAGLPVRYEWISGPGALQGSTVAVTSAGVYRIRAVAEGDDTYLPAAPVEVEFRGVNPPAIQLTEQGAAVRIHDSEHPVPNRMLKD